MAASFNVKSREILATMAVIEDILWSSGIEARCCYCTPDGISDPVRPGVSTLASDSFDLEHARIDRTTAADCPRYVQAVLGV